MGSVCISLSILVKIEVNCHSRTIKEAMFICVQDPTLNRNLGKYQLPHNGTISSRHLQPCSASQPTFQPTQPLLHNTPHWFPPSLSPILLLTTLLPLSHHGGGAQLPFMFFTYGKYMCILNTSLSLSTTSPTPVPSW